MKILELRLEKFGHFEARTLDLSAGASGLHVIHGANEAGKSTSLRAILALLYGFPKQTPDDFRFAYKDLRVGARIEGADGRVHDVVRLKRDKNSLLYADGRPADEGLMRSLLAGVDRAVFERVFGLDQKRLREGGEELQKGGGVLGESLFAAGIGLAQIRKLRDALESEADALFAPRATTKTINELAAKADTLRAEADAAALRAEDHEARERRLADARETSERLAGDIAALDETIARIERRMRARPKFDDLDATERELAELADVPDLPESFAAELTQAATARRTFMNAVQKAEDALTATRHQRAKISVAQRVLDRADAIRELYGQLEAYRRARADLPEAEAERRALAEEAAALLRDLDPSLAAADAAAPRLPVAERKRLEKLAGDYTSIATRRDGVEEHLRSARASLESARAERGELPEAREIANLARMLERIAARGDLERAVADAEAAATGARGERDRALAAMPLWPAGRDDVETAPVPVRETVARFAARESDLDAEQRAVKAELDRLAREVERRDAERRELARERAVPTEEALAAARMRRDQGWRLVRGAWLDEESEPDAWAIYDGEREPADAFEHAMRQADDAADRLRDDAERVARARSLDEDDARDAARRADALRREAEWRERRDAFEAAWAAVWEPTGVAPLSSAEMREWLDAFAALREKARAAREMSDAAERVRVEVSDAQKTLREALRKIGEKTAAGDGVSALIDRAKRIVEEEDRTARAREMLGVTIRDKEREVADLDARLETERARMTQWASDWRAAIATLPVPPDAEPAVASEVLRRLDEFFGKEIRIGDFDTRIVKMRALIEDVSRRADSLCKEAGVDLAGADAADTAMRLSGLLDQAGLDERTLSMLTAQEQRESEALDEARRGLSRVEAEIESLRERARVERADELEDVAVRAARKRARIARRDELRLDLAREAADGDAEALRADVAASTAALDETEWRRATDERARLRGLLDQTNREIGEAGADLRDTAHASKAGELLETRQFALARLRDAVETYRRLRLATHLLRARIESMRERAQNPTMALAGDIFAALTRGSFARLVGDYGGDVPRLQGVRADGDWVGVDGMSDGTRDQLWLALRLAWIELRAEDGLVLPVIADDLLVQFDEDRATAALEALARLSDRTQVLLFTHHRHTSELIRALGDDTRMRVFEHELGM